MASEEVALSRKNVPALNGENRHQLNARIMAHGAQDKKNSGKVRYDGSPVVVIAFEGTGAFDPRRASTMQALGRRLQAQGHDTTNPRFNPATLVEKALGEQTSWSGLGHGPLDAVVRDPKLNKNVQWLSFPSEELEVLGDPKNLSNYSPRQIVKDVIGSTEGRTPGIEAALKAVKDISGQAHAQGKNPKFVLLSHSSGGRSAVKFAERLRTLRNPGDGKPFEVPLAVTIDPVREAHEAMFEAAREVVNKGTEHNANKVRRFLGLPERKVWPPNVGSRKQPESLYRPSNVSQWINFYQTDDTEGLKMSPQFGIHGSPVERATNIRVRGTGSAGHGEINYHPTVVKGFRDALQGVLQRK